MASASVDFKKLLALAACAGVCLFFWDQPWLWPLKLLAVVVHESGHAAATWLAGGSVERIQVATNESGSCLATIPQGYWGRILVSSGGYVGSTVVGALWLVGSLRYGVQRLPLFAFAGWLAAVALGYAGDPFTLIFCLLAAAALGACAKWLSLGATEWLNLLLASFTVLYAVFDLRDDLWNGEVRARSDAAILAAGTPLPALLWAAIWTALSLAVVFLALRHALAAGRLKAKLAL